MSKNLVGEFTSFLRVEKGLSDNTVDNYVKDVTNFLCFITVDPLTVTIHDIRAYLANQQQEGKARASISRYISSIKEFYKFIEMYYEVPNPAKDLKAYHRNANSLPKNLSLSDMGKILQTAKESRFKTQVIVDLLYGTGCRVSELVGLKVEDFDFEEGFITILGKGNKERLVPVSPRTLQLVQTYLQRENIKTGYLFAKRGNPSEHMSRISVTNLMKDLAKRAGVTSNVSAHVMRHSYATHMIENGCDMATMQELLGHSDMRTTKIYAKVTKDLRKKALTNFHPLS